MNNTNTLVNAINQEQTKTENGMSTLSSSMNNLVDLFFSIGAMRGKDITPAFSKAFSTDPAIAARILLWSRDVRGGAGERQIFRNALVYIAQKDQALAEKLIPLVPEVGRWDDLVCLFGTPCERKALQAIVAGLNAGNGLCAKWMDRKGPNANKIRAYMKLTPKEYRKLLVGLTKVVETQMCANDWKNIEFGKTPSLAAARYQAAFNKHAPNEYAAYRAGLVSGTQKINAAAVYPYDIVKSLGKGDEVVANAQWNALPNYLEGSAASILPLVDVSGSMMCPAGGNPNVTCLDVAVSLGLYLSERSNGIFKDAFITFTTQPKLEVLTGNLSARCEQLKGADWCGSTNIEAAFKLILDAATKHKISQGAMPTHLLILSDMQFDSATGHRSDMRAFTMVEDMYKAAGYTMPSIIFWNLRDSNGVPVSFDQNGTALISGFSPAIMKSVLKADNINPVSIMMEAVMNKRYDF